MKKFYLKPEMDEVVELPAVTLMDVSGGPIDDENGNEELAPRWRKSW